MHVCMNADMHESAILNRSSHKFYKNIDFTLVDKFLSTLQNGFNRCARNVLHNSS